MGSPTGEECIVSDGEGTGLEGSAGGSEGRRDACAASSARGASTESDEWDDTSECDESGAVALPGATGDGSGRGARSACWRACVARCASQAWQAWCLEDVSVLGLRLPEDGFERCWQTRMLPGGGLEVRSSAVAGPAAPGRSPAPRVEWRFTRREMRIMAFHASMAGEGDEEARLPRLATLAESA